LNEICHRTQYLGQKLEFDELKESTVSASTEEETPVPSSSSKFDHCFDSSSSSDDEFAGYEEFDTTKS